MLYEWKSRNKYYSKDQTTDYSCDKDFSWLACSQDNQVYSFSQKAIYVAKSRVMSAFRILKTTKQCENLSPTVNQKECYS